MSERPTAPPGADDRAAEEHLRTLAKLDRERQRQTRAGLIHDLAVEYFTRPERAA